MNVLETANILLDYYTPEFINLGIINNGKIEHPQFKYSINNILYELYFNSLLSYGDDNRTLGTDLRIGVSATKERTIFEYTCNEIERLDILKKMDEVSKKWYKNYIEKIKVPIPYENDRKRVEEMVKGVEIVAPSDLV